MVVSPAWDRNAEALRERSLSPSWDRNLQARRERALSPALAHDLTARSSTGIVPKQLQKNNAPGEGIVAEHFEDGALAATAKGRAAIASDYFDGATAADKFVDGAIPTSKLASPPLTSPLTADLAAGGHKITGLGAPTNPADAATKAYVDAAAPSGVIKADGSVPFTADQPLGGHKLTGLGAPTNPADAATKAYVDASGGGGGGSSGPAPYIELGRATTFSLTGGTAQDLAWDADVRNVGGAFSHAPGSTDIVVSTSGLYYFETRLSSNAVTGWGKGFFYIKVNGTVVAHDDHQWSDVHDQTGASPLFTGAVGRFAIHLTAGDHVVLGASIQVFGVSDTVAASGAAFDTYLVGVLLAGGTSEGGTLPASAYISNATPQSVGAANTLYNLGGATVESNKGMTADPSDTSVTVPVAGDYIVSERIEYASNAMSAAANAYLYVNGVITQASVMSPPGVTTFGQWVTFICRLNAGDKLQVGSNSGANGTVTVTTVRLRVVLVSAQSASSDAARLYKSASQSLPSGAETVLTFDREEYNTLGSSLHSTTTNPSRINCVRAGRYLVTALVVFDPSATGVRYVAIHKNGSLNGLGSYQQANQVGGNSTGLPGTWILDLVPGDYVEIAAYQDSGGPLNAFGDTPVHTSVCVAYLGMGGAPAAENIKLALTVAQSIADNSVTAIAFPASARIVIPATSGLAWNPAGAHPERVTCVTPGIYTFTGQVWYPGASANATGVRSSILQHFDSGGILKDYAEQTAVGAAPGQIVSVTADFNLAAGDYVALYAFHKDDNGGGAVNAQSGAVVSTSLAAKRSG
jgi:hypothetical protein